MKACKNASELQGMRACHVRDGAAVVEFLAWLDAHFSAQVRFVIVLKFSLLAVCSIVQLGGAVVTIRYLLMYALRPIQRFGCNVGIASVRNVDVVCYPHNIAALQGNSNTITEVEIDSRLTACRAQCSSFIEPSFATIAGVNENAAIMHYRSVSEKKLLPIVRCLLYC